MINSHFFKLIYIFTNCIIITNLIITVINLYYYYFLVACIPYIEKKKLRILCV